MIHNGSNSEYITCWLDDYTDSRPSPSVGGVTGVYVYKPFPLIVKTVIFHLRQAPAYDVLGKSLVCAKGVVLPSSLGMMFVVKSLGVRGLIWDWGLNIGECCQRGNCGEPRRLLWMQYFCCRVLVWARFTSIT